MNSDRAQLIADRRASYMRAPRGPIRLLPSDDPRRPLMLDGYDLLATIGIDRDREARSRLTPRDPEWTDAAPTGSTFEGLEVLEGRTLIGEIKDGVVVEPARWRFSAFVRSSG